MAAVENKHVRHAFRKSLEARREEGARTDNGDHDDAEHEYYVERPGQAVDAEIIRVIGVFS